MHTGPSSYRPPLPKIRPDTVIREQPLVLRPTKWDKVKRKYDVRCHQRLDKRNTALVDSGAISIFLIEYAPKKNVNPDAPHIKIGANAGSPIISAATCYVSLPELPLDFPTAGHVMKGFNENLVGIGPIFDAKYSMLFNDESAMIISSMVLCLDRMAGRNW